MNLVDQFLTKVINKFFTKDEWHTLVIGFFDGLSFETEGKWMRRALADPDIDVENIDKEKVWYYRVPYVFGEFAKVGFVMLFFGQSCGILFL